MDSSYVSAGYAQFFIQYCNDKFPDNGLSSSSIFISEDPLASVSLDLLNPYIDFLLSTPSKPPHEWLIGEYMTSNANEMYIYALASAQTVRESLAVGHKLHKLQTNIANRYDKTLPNGSLCRYARIRGEITPQKIFVFHTYIALSIIPIDNIFQDGRGVKKMNLSFANFSELIPEIQKEYGLFEIRYSPGEFSMLFPDNVLNIKMKDSHEGIKEVLVKELEAKLEKMPKDYSLKDRVSEYIRAQLGKGANLESICESLNLTRRTLSRHLEKENTSFSKLLNTIRKEKTMQLIQDRSIPLKKVATLSGFGSLSQFNASFKSWTGVTPASYRKNADA